MEQPRKHDTADSRRDTVDGLNRPDLLQPPHEQFEALVPGRVRGDRHAEPTIRSILGHYRIGRTLTEPRQQIAVPPVACAWIGAVVDLPSRRPWHP